MNLAAKYVWFSRRFSNELAAEHVWQLGTNVASCAAKSYIKKWVNCECKCAFVCTYSLHMSALAVDPPKTSVQMWAFWTPKVRWPIDSAPNLHEHLTFRYSCAIGLRWLRCISNDDQAIQPNGHWMAGNPGELVLTYWEESQNHIFVILAVITMSSNVWYKQKYAVPQILQSLFPVSLTSTAYTSSYRSLGAWPSLSPGTVPSVTGTFLNDRDSFETKKLWETSLKRLGESTSLWLLCLDLVLSSAQHVEATCPPLTRFQVVEESGTSHLKRSFLRLQK